MRHGLVAFVIAFLVASCGQDSPKADTDDPQYKLGYEAGKEDGVTEVCNQIEDYKDSMATALKDANICPGG